MTYIYFQGTVLPSFKLSLVQVLKTDTKKEIAMEYDNILHQIVKDVKLKEGSGNKRYYRKLEAQLLLAYSRLNNAVFRNKLRRSLTWNVLEEDLSEDSKEEDNLNTQLHQWFGETLN